MYGKLVNGQLMIAPSNYLTDNNQMIFDFDKNIELMKKNGFKEVIKNEPHHDAKTHQIVFSHYEETASNIVEVYTIVAKPLTQDEKIEALEMANKEAQEQIAIVSEAVDFLLFSQSSQIARQTLKGGEVTMAAYFAMRIMQGKLTYEKVMSVEVYRQFKPEIDAILIAEGHEHLIKEVK